MSRNADSVRLLGTLSFSAPYQRVYPVRHHPSFVVTTVKTVPYQMFYGLNYQFWWKKKKGKFMTTKPNYPFSYHNLTSQPQHI